MSITIGRDVARRYDAPYIEPQDSGFRLHYHDPESGTYKIPVYRKRTGRSLHADRSNENICFGTWTESVTIAHRKTGVDPGGWVCVLGTRGHSTWVPAWVAERAKADRLCWGSTKTRIKFSDRGLHPCTCQTRGDWSSRSCGRPAVHAEEGGDGLYEKADQGQVWRCKMHQAAHEKVKANDAARAAQWAEQREAYQHRLHNEQRCNEVLDKIRPLLEELGVHPDTLAVGRSGNKVGILLPAETAEMLTGAAIELEEIRSYDR